MMAGLGGLTGLQRAAGLGQLSPAPSSHECPEAGPSLAKFHPLLPAPSPL